MSRKPKDLLRVSFQAEGNREPLDIFNPLYYRDFTRTAEVYTGDVEEADDCMGILSECCFTLITSSARR